MRKPCLEQHVEKWFDMPPVGGTAMTRDGVFYFTDLNESALKRRLVNGKIETVIKDKMMHWTDAPFIDQHNTIWMPVPQMDRVALFQNGRNNTEWPVRILTLDLNKS